LKKESEPKGTAALTKGINLLKVIAEASQSLTVKELSEAVALPRPTVYRLLATLIKSGLVRQSTAGHAYQIGNTLIGIANRALEKIEIRDIAHEFLLALRDETGETVHLAVFHNNAMLYVDNLDSPERVRMACSLGATVPLHNTAVGKTYLAFLSEAEREALMDKLPLPQVTGRSITSREALRAEVLETASRGWATDEEENERDIFCFGAPVLNREGRPVAGISISVPRFRIRAKIESAYIEPLLKTTAAVSNILGAPHETLRRMRNIGKPKRRNSVVAR
jgi:IclR family KDG regulon transcriptional repressor